jgi:cyclopropane fatty-acyl-phospholipid synthase-like methyltransferase
MSAIEVWKQRVAAHHAQSRKVRAALGVTTVDQWETASPFFKADPRRMRDVEVNRLVQEVNPSTTVLDVGGGAGRFALPLALRCQHVTVVEPSPSMRESLCQIAAEASIDNITIVAKRWEEAEVNPADVVISAHVVYMIEDIQAFVVKLVEHAREKVLMPTFMRPPMARYAPFWRWVHGENRAELPGAAEFMQVLWEMGLYPNIEMFEPEPYRALKDWQTALQTLRRRMYVKPGTDAEARLLRAMHELLLETSDGYAMRGMGPGRLVLISWRPE